MSAMRSWMVVCLLALLVSGPGLAADAMAAKVVMLTGQATAVGDDGTVRKLSREDAVYTGDLINSGPGSYVNLQFVDGAFFLLRPNSRFLIEDYHYADPAKLTEKSEPAPSVAGPAPAAPPTVVAKTANGAPSQAEVTQACASSQVCRDCRAGKDNHSKACNLCFARVQNCKNVKNAFLAAQQAGASQTAAPPAAPVVAPTPTAPADTTPPIITTGAEGSGETSRAFFRLLKGGFRSVSGLIGKASHDDYRVSTPVATIGIRGTRYGARLCQGDCSDRDEILAKLRAAGRGARAGETILVTTVEEGEISLRTLNSEGVQLPGTTRLIGEDGSIIETDEPPSTERNDQDLNPESCGTE